MAGNIPAVGFHDVLCVLLNGDSALIKLSSKDTVLLKFLLEKLIEINPGFSSKIQYAERLKDFDAVIATGSDNTSRYFEYYFGKYPHIIRKNRTSVAILDGTKTNKILFISARMSSAILDWDVEMYQNSLFHPAMTLVPCLGVGNHFKRSNTITNTITITTIKNRFSWFQ